VLNGRGKYLIPGLWDMHAHLIDPAFYSLLLRAGVTGVRHMLGVNPAFAPRDPDAVMAWSARPRVIRAQHAVDGPDTPFPLPASLNVVRLANPAGVGAALDRVKAGGDDFVKVYSTVPRAAYHALVPAARARGLAVDGHVPREVTAAEASALGQRTIDHLDGVAVGCARDGARLRAE
jgi:imidazolonepropionase-like amidohydrolase